MGINLWMFDHYVDGSYKKPDIPTSGDMFDKKKYDQKCILR